MSIHSALLLALLSGQVVTPPSTAPAPRDKPQTSLRTFDVHGLALDIPNYPLTPSMIPGETDSSASNAGGGSRQTLWAQAPSEGQAAPSHNRLSALIKLIESSVAPDSWTDAGGAPGSISAFQTRLIVTQTPENLLKIQQLLDQLAADSPAALRVNAIWLLLKPAQIESLREQFQKPNEAIVVIDKKTLSESQIYSRGQTTGFDGQTVHISAVSEHRYISDASPVVGTGVAGYALTMSTVRSGVALEITPHLTSPDTVRLDLLNIVSDVAGVSDKDIPLQSEATTLPSDRAIIERPRVQTSQFQTNVQIPLGKDVMIGGMTINPGEALDSQKQLYLVVNVHASR